MTLVSASGVFLTGLCLGAVTLVISELLLRFSGVLFRENTWRMTVTGTALRTVWVLLMMVVFVAPSAPHQAAAIFGLLSGYLVSQVVEGWRYQRFFEQVRR